MKGQPEVVDYLNFLLRGELAARDQYLIHSRRYEDLGFRKLYQRIDHEMQEEAQHADVLIRRILFLEGDPDMRPEAFVSGRSVEEMLEKDLQLEYAVRGHLAKGVALCEQHGDYVSRDLLVAQMKDTEEDHTLWLEQQLRLIRRLGAELYLQTQIGDAE
jgi:bacterioferritin